MHKIKNLTGVAYSGVYGKNRKMNTAGPRQNEKECEANARLIAAAPELEEALRDMMLCHDQGPDSERWLRDKIEQFIDPLDSTGEEEDRAVMLVKERTLDAARAALRKAGLDT